MSETTDGCVISEPTGLRVTSHTDDSVSLSWDSLADAAVYKVEYKESSAVTWLHADYVFSGTSETVGGLDCDTEYSFRVRARGDGSPYTTTYGDPSTSVSETTDGCVISAPTGLRVTSDTEDSVSLSWDALTGAGAYKVEYKESSAITWLHADYVFSGTSETVGGLDCNTEYSFRVRARGDGIPYSYVYGDPSTSVSETTDGCVISEPTGLRVTSDTDDSVSLSWDSLADAAVYKVEYKESSAVTWLHADYVFSGTSETVGGLDCDTEYSFRVRARGDGSPYTTTYGDPSTSVSETTDGCVISEPTGLRVTSDTKNSVSLSWDSLTGAGAYKVEYKESSAITWLHASYVYSGTAETVDGLDCNTEYSFRVRARGDGIPYSTVYGDPSTSVSETTDGCVISEPTGLRVTSHTDDSVSLSWDALTDAGAYKVEYKESSAVTWLHADYVFTGTSETVGGLDCDTEYSFRVRARGDGSPYTTTYGDPSTSVSETTDGCSAPVVEIAAGTSPIAEGEDATFTITADPAPSSVLTVNITVDEEGSFLQNTPPTTVTVPTSGSATLTLPTENDTVDEGDGSVEVTIDPGTGYDVGSDDEATVEVEDDDPASPTDSVPDFGSATIANQMYVVDEAITALQLPSATGGDGTLTYTLAPGLPTGLTFDDSVLTITGTPTAAIGATTYTYTVTDSDAVDPDSDTLTFTIEVGTDRPCVFEDLGSVAPASGSSRMPPPLPATSMKGERGEWSSNCASLTRSGSYARYYRFELQTQGNVQIDLVSTEDTYLYLHDDAGAAGTTVTASELGSEVEENDDAGGGSAELADPGERSCGGDVHDRGDDVPQHAGRELHALAQFGGERAGPRP